jgi:glycosyltransferase involved in cell wall biosynthesis
MVARPDRDSVSGGDLVQIAQTAAGLANRDVEARLASSVDDFDLPRFDLIHCFHLPAVSTEIFRRLRACGARLVLSPVFWDTTALWFDRASREKRRWRRVRAMVGEGAGRRLFVAWQHAKRHRSPEWAQQREILEHVDLILPNSWIELEHLARYFKLDYGRLKQRARAVPNGVDDTMFTNPAPTGSEFRIRYGLTEFVVEVARIEPAKGQLELIEATQRLNLPLVLIGQESPYEPEYVAQCREAGARRGNTFFLGKLPQAELVGAYKAARVHVLPSWRETPGLATLEAAAAGCKVVSTDAGSAREYLGGLARYCQPGRAGDIRRAVLTALDAPSDGGRLRDHVLTNFTWARAAEATHVGYLSLLA